MRSTRTPAPPRGPRSRPLLFLWAALCALGLASRATAQQQKLCKECRGDAVLVCEDDHHKGVDCSMEDGVHFCSFLAGCPTCSGTGRVDCPECERPEEEAALGRAKLRATQLEQRLAYLDEGMERSVHKGESEHFRLVWDVDQLKVGRKKLDAHELLHLYLERMERVHARYVEVLGVNPRDIVAKPLLMVWNSQLDHKLAAGLWVGSVGAMGVKLMGHEPTYSMCANRSLFRGDEEIHRYMVHNTTHLLFSATSPAYWIGQLKGGAWLDEGLSSWMEIDLMEEARTFCFQEQNAKQDFAGGEWRVAVRKGVAKDDLPSVSQVMSRSVNDLTPEEQAVAFSLVDYLLKQDGKQVAALGAALRGRKELRDALNDTFGVNSIELERGWKEWVLETYPTR